ncbi:hypothetical protein ACLOJK_011349 [Asimina triloba]
MNLQVDEIGRVVSVGDGIACVYRLNEIQFGEMTKFASGVKRIALNLENENVGIVVFGSDTAIKKEILSSALDLLQYLDIINISPNPTNRIANRAEFGLRARSKHPTPLPPSAPQSHSPFTQKSLIPSYSILTSPHNSSILVFVFVTGRRRHRLHRSKVEGRRQYLRRRQAIVFVAGGLSSSSQVGFRSASLALCLPRLPSANSPPSILLFRSYIFHSLPSAISLPSILRFPICLPLRHLPDLTGSTESAYLPSSFDRPQI